MLINDQQLTDHYELLIRMQFRLGFTFGMALEKGL